MSARLSQKVDVERIWGNWMCLPENGGTMNKDEPRITAAQKKTFESSLDQQPVETWNFCSCFGGVQA